MVFYRSFYEALRDLDNNTKAILYDAIFDYGLNFKEPELTGIAKTVFTLIRPQLDANIRKFDNGSKGGRPHKEEPTDNLSETKEEPKQNQIETKAEANVNANANEKVNGNSKENTNASPPHPLIVWIENNAPTVQKLKQPLTNEQAEKILIDLAINTEDKKKALKDMMLSMENYVPLTKTSKSANLTIRKWWAKQGAVTNVSGQPTEKVKMNTETYNR